MKRILVLNSSNSKSSFDVSYSTQTQTKVTTISTPRFISQIFRLIEIPENAINIVITIYSIDVRLNKIVLRKENFAKALNVCYEIYQEANTIKAKTVACEKFKGACSILGVNKSKTIIRAKVVYTLDGVIKNYISNPIHRDEAFGFLVPANAKKIKIQVDRCVSVIHDTWANIYYELVFSSNVPIQKCYLIRKPLLLTNVICNPVNCLSIQ